MRGMISVSLFHQPLPIPNPILPIRKQKTRTSTHTQKKKETSEQKQNQTISWPTNEIANSVCSVRLTALNHIAPAIFSQYSSLFGLLCPHSKSRSPPPPKKETKNIFFLKIPFHFDSSCSIGSCDNSLDEELEMKMECQFLFFISGYFLFKQ